MMNPREHTAASPMIKQGISVAPGNVDTFPGSAILAPFNGYPMSRILRSDPEHGRKSRWPDMLEADKANTCNSFTGN